MNTALSFGIIILAAGNSSRLGEPKQLLRFKGKSLIRNVTEAALAVQPDNVVVVTGATEALVSLELKNLKIHFAHNADWPEGMGSSIRCGLGKLLLLDPKTDFVILAVSDQPFVTSEVFQNLVAKSKTTDNSIIACTYKGIIGTPVLFKKQHFDALFHLKGAEGAKKLLKQFERDVLSVSFLQGEVDIDTKEDYENLLEL